MERYFRSLELVCNYNWDNWLISLVNLRRARVLAQAAFSSARFGAALDKDGAATLRFREL